MNKRRALGQHFLKDRATADTIADAAIERAQAHGCRGLLEIGPGRGAITHPLLERLAAATSIDRFTLVETDRALAAYWREQQGQGKRIHVEEADFLQLPEERWLKPVPLAVVSNLPYSSGTAILQRLARRPEIPVMVLMFQAEVARRLRAEPSSKEWGSLSIWVQNRWDVRKLLHVPPGAFSPPPRVDSEVVLMERRAAPRIAVAPGQEARWEGLLRAAFAHRRKMLRSGLPTSGPYRNALELSGVDGKKRAEALHWDEWESLFKAAVSVP